jgi:hypothetical protein
MKFTFYVVLVALIILLMAFIMVSSSADYYYPGNSQVNFSVYLNTTNTGIYVVNITTYVNDASGNPVADGTVVDFSIEQPVSSYTPPVINNGYNLYYNGSLNNVSPHVSVPTRGGKAVVQYGWFPDNQMPSGYVHIIAVLNKTPSVNTTLDLQFNGTTLYLWTQLPVLPPDNTPTSTPLSSMITLLSLTVGAAITLAVRRK